MNRPFLFLSGEYETTMPLVFSREQWQHTMTALPLVMNEDGTFHRDKLPGERLLGVVWYASSATEDDHVRTANLALLHEMALPCWPSPLFLRAWDNRHDVMRECMDAGLVQHEVQTRIAACPPDLPRPFVLKTGNLHQGHGKYLIRDGDEIPYWHGVATAEPFFEGVSARVLIIGSQWFGIRYDNPNTWVKNAPGAELEMWPDISLQAVEHAQRVHEHFGLEISGIDYIISPDGTPHFLEYNHFPGVSVSDETQEAARKVFAKAMDKVEALSAKRLDTTRG